GLAAFLGHIFPVWLKLKGGKGVATGAGVVAVLMPVPTFGAAIVWSILFITTQYVSLASVVAAAALVGLQLALVPTPFAPGSRMVTAFSLLAFALVAIRHRDNLARL